MAQDYSQFRAMRAIMVASLRATFKSPQLVFFSLFFPIVLIVIFGSLGRGGSGMGSVEIAMEPGADTSTAIYRQLRALPGLHFSDKSDVLDELKKGRITALVNIRKEGEGRYALQLKSSTASQRNLPQLISLLNNMDYDAGQLLHPDPETVVTVSNSLVPGGRKYNMIDFLLPGMIGFSLIGTAVFGVAFLFFSLRETLVLKRLYSTPIRRNYIILGEGLSKVIYLLVCVMVLVLFGHYVYGFTLANGWQTFVEMLVISFLALTVFLGFGFFFSSVAKNQNLIPIYANLFMFPQYFLSGTFFSKSALPESIQPFIRFLPLTAVNDALRNVAFEGTPLWRCWPELAILAGWGLLIYIVNNRVFRWE